MHNVPTLTALKRTLKPGMELTLVHTFRGDCRVRRTVQHVQTNAVVLITHGDPGDLAKNDSESWLYFGRGADYHATPKGFKFDDNDDMHEGYIEYEWGHNL